MPEQQNKSFLLPGQVKSGRFDGVANAVLCLFLIAFYANFIFKLGNYKTYFYFTLFIFLIAALPSLVRFASARLLITRILRTGWPELILPSLAVVASLTEATDFAKRQNIQHVVFLPLLTLITAWTVIHLNQRLRFSYKWLVYILILTALAINWLSLTPEPEQTGIYRNSHYLALLCYWAIPTLIYFCHTAPNRILLGITLVSILPAVHLLVATGSRPAWLALIAAYPITGLLTYGARGLLRTAAIIALTTIALAFTFPTRFLARGKELLLDVSKDERASIWETGWTMLTNNSLLDWLVGHGIGAFEVVYPTYLGEYSKFIFPHNFILELLFDTGIAGLTLFLIALGSIAYKLFALSGVVRHDKHTRALFQCLSVLTIAHLIFCFLTVSVYSIYFIILFSLPVGFILYLTLYHDQQARS